MWYLVKAEGKWKSVHYGNTYSDETYNFLRRCGVEVGGQFGREDYCDFWRDRYNQEEATSK